MATAFRTAHADAVAGLVRHRLFLLRHFTWLPKLLVEQGNTVVKTFEYVLVMIVAQLPGYIAAAALVEKSGAKRLWRAFSPPVPSARGFSDKAAASPKSWHGAA